MIRIKDAAKAAAAKVFEGHSEVHVSSAGYKWDENEINLWTWAIRFTGPINHQSCNAFRRRFILELVGYSKDNSTIEGNYSGDFILRWFGGASLAATFPPWAGLAAS